MSPGTIQLVSTGIQDKWIITDGSAETGVSFFNQVWRKHSNFSQLVEEQKITGAVTANGLSTIQIQKTGDLLGYTYFTIDNGTAAQDSSTHAWTTLIKSIELVVGGVVVDEQTSDFMENIAVDLFAGNVSKSSNGPHPGSSSSSYFFPLRFAYCEQPSTALNLAAIPYANVELRIRWGANAANYKWQCFTQMYYLGNEERAMFSDTTTEKHQLIFQVQKNIASNDTIQELTFSHPVKFIASSNTLSSSLKSTTNKIKISINGTDLSPFKWARPNFMDVTHYYHTSTVTSPDIFMYPFCMQTSLLQPSGSLNCSRISSFKIHSESEILTDDIYAVNLQILTYLNGIAATRYAN
jgi:hypothetical protein